MVLTLFSLFLLFRRFWSGSSVLSQLFGVRLSVSLFYVSENILPYLLLCLTRAFAGNLSVKPTVFYFQVVR